MIDNKALVDALEKIKTYCQSIPFNSAAQYCLEISNEALAKAALSSHVDDGWIEKYGQFLRWCFEMQVSPISVESWEIMNPHKQYFSMLNPEQLAEAYINFDREEYEKVKSESELPKPPTQNQINE